MRFRCTADRSADSKHEALTTGGVGPRYDPDVPLIVPEVNGDALAPGATLVANPNCTTAIALMALAPLHKESAGWVQDIESQHLYFDKR